MKLTIPFQESFQATLFLSCVKNDNLINCSIYTIFIIYHFRLLQCSVEGFSVYIASMYGRNMFAGVTITALCIGMSVIVYYLISFMMLPKEVLG